MKGPALLLAACALGLGCSVPLTGETAEGSLDVHWLEGAICGIGGGIAIPSTVGKVGNFPMEDLVTMLEEMGVDTGMKSSEVIAAAKEIGKRLGIPVDSHRGTGCTREDVMRAGADNPNHPQVTAHA